MKGLYYRKIMDIKIKSLRYDNSQGFEPGFLYCFNGELKGDLCVYCIDRESCDHLNEHLNNSELKRNTIL